MARPKKPTITADLASDIEKNLRTMMSDEQATIAERTKLMELGVKLLLVQHKIAGDDDGENMFG